MSASDALAADLSASRIGPNALIQVAGALETALGRRSADLLFRLAGLSPYRVHPPQRMVDEAEVARLHRSVRATVGPAEARRVFSEAGRRTADYLLAHRIPRPLQSLLRRLPARWAARVLLSAISRHAWTFAGSGQFAVARGFPVRLSIRNNPLCRGLVSSVPICDYYASTFEQLFRVLVHPASRVQELACEAAGAPACLLEVRW